MKITDIEVIPITMPLAKRYEEHDGPIRMYDMDQHVIVKIHTDNGLVGYGDSEDYPDVPQAAVDRLIGRNPFDFIHNDLHIALGMALYDVMGKHLEVPAYKLMGQKMRDAVPVAAWTRPCGPEVFRGEVERAVDQGYTIFKMHTSTLYDVVEQTRAAEEVAPPGFKIHWDFNHNRTMGTVLPIIEELERNHPIVGFIEDPLRWEDIDGWARLREKVHIPIVMHSPRLGGMQEVLRGVADIYMLGTRPIGDTLTTGFAYGKANIQVIIQQSGNTLMKALALHQGAVLPTATAHMIILDDQYDEDITTEKIPVVEGFSRVPEGPGLGVEVDEDALAQAAERKHIEVPRFIGMLHMPGGHRICTRGAPSVARVTGYEEGAIRGIHFTRWVDDGSPEFERFYQRVSKEGAIVEQGDSEREGI